MTKAVTALRSVVLFALTAVMLSELTAETLLRVSHSLESGDRNGKLPAAQTTNANRRHHSDPFQYSQIALRHATAARATRILLQSARRRRVRRRPL